MNLPVKKKEAIFVFQFVDYLENSDKFKNVKAK
jgi:hypothetical protein